MSVWLVEGPAGSGKTTRLFDAAAEYLKENALQPQQRVPALTKMHGSRRRMHAKLTEVLGRGTLSDCTTLNGFVLGLVQRWQTLARRIVDPLPPDTSFGEFAEIAASLLAHEAVVRWVAVQHPVLIVDELQDLRGAELGVIKALASGLNVLCAADEFQDLDPQGVCEAVDWARADGRVEPLTQIHRTKVPALLAAARAVRAGKPPDGGSKFKIFAVRNPNVAASFMARNLEWSRGTQVAILSPSGPERSPFVRDALARLREKPFEKDGRSFGPFDVSWETTATDDLRRWADLLRLGDDDTRMISADGITVHAAELPGPLLDWVQSRGRLAGSFAFSVGTVRAQLGRAQALLRAHVGPRRLKRSGLTIHQAKNREFDRVIVLWPVTVRADLDTQRRLLYNAITRAKHECIIIVQDPNGKKSRLNVAPFS